MNKLSRHSTAVMIVGILLAGMLFLLQGCSTNKNTAANRRYQEFITRYNIHYNGDTHYKETLEDMEKQYQDDYTRLLFVHPAEAHGVERVPQPSGDFTRSIEKAQKAIQTRSIKKKPARKAGRGSDQAYKAWMKREEYNPFLHNSWMMMGRSQFMNGDFSGAAATFFYISRHFNWIPATVTEAKLWQARSYCAMGWLFEAETILTRIKTDELTSKTLKRLYNETYADLLVRSHSYAEALPYLTEAARLSSGVQKTRLNFLTGQIASLAGDRQLAYKAFGKVVGATSAPYRTQFNARIKQSEVFEGDNVRSEVNSLRNMLRYDRNKEYQDQIYYAIGNLYLSRKDTLNAIENYRLAAEKSTRNGIDKAISQVTLGGLYYDRHQYDLAQPCYAQSVPQLPETYPDYRTLKQRSDMLDELAVYVQNVNLQDSLLNLSYMEPEQRLVAVEKIIKELEKKEKQDAEDIERENFMSNQPSGNTNPNNSDRSFTMNNDGSWYFYNPSTVQAGKTDFQRRWGNRKLEDDWRRRNKTNFNFDELSGDQDDETEEPDDESQDERPDNGHGQNDGNADNPDDDLDPEERKKRESDPHFPEYYLKNIPLDSASRANSHTVIQEGLYNMGLILKDKLEDYPSALIPWNRLLYDYPDNIYRLDTYFNLYLMAERTGDTAKADYYRNLILTEFAESKEGVALSDPNYIENLRLMDERQEKMYEEAFDAYMADRNEDVHRLYDEMTSQFSMSPLLPRFMFLHALAYVTEQRPDDFKQVLTEMLERYPDTDLSPYASSWLKGISQGRQLMSDTGGSNMRGLLWDIKLTTDTLKGSDGAELEFDLNPEDTQLLVLLYPNDSISHNELLYNIARHNFNTFAIKDFDLEQMNFGKLGLLIVHGFDNLSEIKLYRALMQENPELSIPRGVIPVVISEKNFETLLKHGATFEQYFEFARDKNYRDTEEAVLDPEIFGPSYGLPPEESGDDEQPESEPEDDIPAGEQDGEEPGSQEQGGEELVPSGEPEETPVEPRETETKVEEKVIPEKPVLKEIEPEKKPTEEKKPVEEKKTTENKTQATEKKPDAKTTQSTNKPLTGKVANPKAPAKKHKPAKKNPTKLHDYPVGSEGDDPLLD